MSPRLPAPPAAATTARHLRRRHGKYNLTVGDIVYVDGGMAAGLSPGVVYSIVRPLELVHNPDTEDVVGRVYQYQGRLRLLTVQDQVAIAEIVQACDSIIDGAGLKPFVPEPVPLGRRTGLRRPRAGGREAAGRRPVPALEYNREPRRGPLGSSKTRTAGARRATSTNIYRANESGRPLVSGAGGLSVHPRARWPDPGIAYPSNRDKVSPSSSRRRSRHGRGSKTKGDSIESAQPPRARRRGNRVSNGWVACGGVLDRLPSPKTSGAIRTQDDDN